MRSDARMTASLSRQQMDAARRRRASKPKRSEVRRSKQEDRAALAKKIKADIEVLVCTELLAGDPRNCADRLRRLDYTRLPYKSWAFLRGVQHEVERSKKLGCVSGNLLYVLEP